MEFTTSQNLAKIVGELQPSVEEVAQAIARRDKARIIPTGIYAENILGLTTQVPMKCLPLPSTGCFTSGQN